MAIKSFYFLQAPPNEQIFFLISGLMLIVAALVYYFYLRPRIFKRLMGDEDRTGRS